MHETTKIIESEGALFKKILGKKWNNVHPDIKQRFEKHSSPTKPIKYYGQLEKLNCSFLGKILAHGTKFFIKGALIPYTGNNIPVDVLFYKASGAPHFVRQRIYRLPNQKPIYFTSYVKEAKPGEIVEYIAARLGMRLMLDVQEGHLYFQSNGYFLDLGFCRLPIPTLLTPGTTYITHKNEGENKFRIRIDIHHIIFGKMFIQEGVFYEK